MSEELIEELDFIQPKKVVGEMISMSVIEDIKAEIVKIVTEIYAPTLILQIF